MGDKALLFTEEAGTLEVDEFDDMIEDLEHQIKDATREALSVNMMASFYCKVERFSVITAFVLPHPQKGTF